MLAYLSVLRQSKPAKLFLLAVILGLLAAYLAISYLKIREDAYRQAYLRPETDTISVVVTANDLPRGAIINSENMAVRDIPKAYVHNDVIMPENFNQAVGRKLLEPITAGKSVPWAFIAGEGHRDFSDLINKGRRAATIQVDEINSVSGLIKPGNFIDLFAIIPTATLGTGSGETVFPIIENILVLATGRRSTNVSQELENVAGINEGYNTLTLDLSPKEAAMLVILQEVGKISAVLRNREDKGRAGFESIQSTDLFSLAAAQAAARESGIVTDETGKTIGRVVSRIVEGKPVEVVVDENGNEIGRVVNGKVVDNNGKQIGKLPKDIMVDASGNTIGTVVTRVIDGKPVKVVVDENGNEIGRVVNGKVIDASGNEIGKVASLKSRNSIRISQVAFTIVEFIVGGKSKDGIAEIQKIRLQ